MRKLLGFIIVMLLFSCNSETAGDCFQTAGNLVQEERTVSSFSKILVKEGIELILKEDATHSVIVEGGKNLLNDIQVSVKNNELILVNNNTCNWVRDYAPVKVIASSPNITHVRSATQYDVISDGVLNYPSFNIISEDFNLPESQNIGDFYLQLNCQSFSLVFNNLSNCFISGAAVSANINFASGNARFEGENFMVDNITLYHRGSNDMLLNPQLSISGDIYSTGNVILFNTPPTVNITEHYKGKLITN